MRTCRTLLIYCVSFTACFCASIAMDLACGPETDPYDYYVSFFHNNLQGGNEYKPFYFTSYQFVYDDTEPASEADVNAEEWAAYLGKDVSAADVSKAMYHLNSSADSLLQNTYFKTGDKLPDSLAGNSFLKALQIKKNPIALKYYRFAKSVEKVANLHNIPWEPTPVDTASLYLAGTQALKSAVLERDKFIQLRYYYQAQRLLHYSRNFKEASKVYDKYLAFSQSKSHIRGWALALKAGELRRMKDTVQSAYLFTQVFAQYPERRIQAYQNYKYMHVTSAQLLPLAANSYERAVIYAIDGFGNPELNMRPLEKVYESAPTSPMVGLLLVREVNKLEEQYLTPKLLAKSAVITTSYYADQDGKKNLQLLNHMNQLRAFCKLLATEHKYPDYNIGSLAAAYISWMQGDSAAGTEYLRALNTEKLSTPLNDEKQIIQLLLTSQSIQKLNDVNEAQLLPALQWLQTKYKAEQPPAKDTVEVGYPFKDDQKFTKTAGNFYNQILAPAYLKQGDTVKAALALLKSPAGTNMDDFWKKYLHSTQIGRIIRYKKTAPTVPYINFLSSDLKKIEFDYLYELQGTALLREHQYAKAIAALKLVSPKYLNATPEDYYKGDPFVDKINDYPKVMRYGKNKGYNKLQFAEAMSGLEVKIKSDAVNASTYYYRYATGLYNTSHYGNSWYMISYGWTGNDFARADAYSYDADYIRTKNAQRYYLLARSLSTNEEFMAKCTFMAAKCQQKQYIKPGYFAGTNFDEAQSIYMHQIRANDYFTDLRLNYKKTAILKKAVGECSYLKDFIMMSK